MVYGLLEKHHKGQGCGGQGVVEEVKDLGG